MATEREAQQRINDVARVLIAIGNVHIEPGLESERAVVQEIQKLDRDGLKVVLGLAKTLLTLGGEDAPEEEESDG